MSRQVHGGVDVSAEWTEERLRPLIVFLDEVADDLSLMRVLWWDKREGRLASRRFDVDSRAIASRSAKELSRLMSEAQYEDEELCQLFGAAMVGVVQAVVDLDALLQSGDRLPLLRPLLWWKRCHLSAAFEAIDDAFLRLKRAIDNHFAQPHFQHLLQQLSPQHSDPFQPLDGEGMNLRRLLTWRWAAPYAELHAEQKLEAALQLPPSEVQRAADRQIQRLDAELRARQRRLDGVEGELREVRQLCDSLLADVCAHQLSLEEAGRQVRATQQLCSTFAAENDRLMRRIADGDRANAGHALLEENLQEALIAHDDVRAANDALQCSNAELLADRGEWATRLRAAETRLRAVEEEKTALEGKWQCRICYDAEVDVLLQPCNHAVCCRQCATRLSQCPRCARPIGTRCPLLVA